jgi:hypothetical protein
MNSHQTIIRGTLHPDGIVQLDESPGLPLGRVEIILHSLESPRIAPVSSQPKEANPKPRGPNRIPTPGSALELAGDLVGCVEGPGDLTTNPKYMEGYGR